MLVSEETEGGGGINELGVCELYPFIPFLKKKKKKEKLLCLDPLITTLTAFVGGDVRASQSRAARSRRCLLNSPQGPLRAKWEKEDGRLKQPFL